MIKGLLCLLFLSQISGSLIPRYERKGFTQIALGFFELTTGMGGSYGFFTPSNFWFGQSVGTEIEYEDGAKKQTLPLENLFTSAGRLRYANIRILWSFYYEDVSKLEEVSDRIERFVRSEKPEANKIKIIFYYDKIPSFKEGNFERRIVYWKQYR